MEDTHGSCPRHQDFIAASVLQQEKVERERCNPILFCTFWRDGDGGKETVAGVTSTQQIA